MLIQSGLVSRVKPIILTDAVSLINISYSN
jgi:hypothetical protein